MAYRTILAYLDEPGRCAAILECARSLAERNEAHLIGLHVVPSIQVYVASEAQVGLEVFEAQRLENTQMAEGMQAAFTDAMKGASCTVEWRAVDEGVGGIAERILEHGLVADLVVTGQVDPEIESRRRVGTPEHVLVHGGRPLLLIPYIGKFASVGRRIMIAWNMTSEAARAAFDALPLLTAADRVTILSIDPERRSELDSVASGTALAESLARHGVSATTHATMSSGIGVGATLLSRLADEDIDLLVMGGYGHSRLGEYLFGGATREILQQMTVPVLMSH